MQTARPKTPLIAWLKQQPCISLSSGGWKAEIGVPEWWGSGGAVFLACRQPSLCVLTWWREKALVSSSKALVSPSGLLLKTPPWALAGVAQWIERRPVNQKVVGLISSQGTCLGCRPGPQ